MANEHPESGSNFIRSIIAEDLAAGRYKNVVTRFPPEPNGYPHIGHAKSICLNFGLALDFGGRCHLRMDDTNPSKEEQEYVDALARDVRWLGFDWGEHFYHASDYFEECYRYAEKLIIEAKAYVDSLNEEEIRAYRGTVSEAGKPSPYRDRSVEENLSLFRRMRKGEFPDGAHVLRAKGDLSAANMKMRDPLLYRIRHATHHRTGDAWCIYPMYDYAHPISDAIEGVTHSICTLEFENNRDIYDWVFENCAPTIQIGPEKGQRATSKQIEFARLNLTCTVVSKRKLLKLVQDGVVRGWDDPRMPTLAGLRRRGVTPEAIRLFTERVGVARANSTVEIEVFDGAIREDLNLRCPRMLGVLHPLKVVLTSWPEGEVDWQDAPLWPAEFGKEGSRKVPFTKELWIDRDDFLENPPKKFHRLAPGKEVRLRHGYIIRCDEVIKDEAGTIVELRCTHDPATRSGQDSRKVQGTIHWVSASHGVSVEARLYERLFAIERPDAEDNFLDHVNPASLETVTAWVEPALAEATPGSRLQLERLGYFYVEPEDSVAGKPVLNRIVGLKDSWAKEAPAPQKKEPETPTKVEEVARVSKADRSREPAEQAHFLALSAAGLSVEDADLLAADAELRAFYEAALALHPSPRTVAAWVANEVQRERKTLSGSPDAKTFAQLIARVDDGSITRPVAKELLVEVLNGAAPDALIQSRGLGQIGDRATLEALVAKVLSANSEKVNAYRGGKVALFGFFVGAAMKESGGKANPGLLQELLKAALS